MLWTAWTSTPGIATEDDAGNVLSDDVYYYDEASRSYYALNVAVTAENYEDYLDSTVPYAPVSNQLDSATHAEKSVWLDIPTSPCCRSTTIC